VRLHHLLAHVFLRAAAAQSGKVGSHCQRERTLAAMVGGAHARAKGPGVLRRGGQVWEGETGCARAPQGRGDNSNLWRYRHGVNPAYKAS
jgi:hypothetical protein